MTAPSTPTSRVRIPSRSKHLAAALLVCALAVGGTSSAFAEDDEDAVNCTVRIERDERLTEAYATAPTVEEASDAALEGACALFCVPEEGGDDTTSTAKPGSDDEEGDDSDSPEVEACIDSCADGAIVIGTLCTDKKSRTLYKDGAFDDGDDVERAKKPGKGDKAAPK